jgi:hypothetical protein
MKPHVFISHTSADIVWCRTLAFDLQARGFRVWFDEWELNVGDSINDKIAKAINETGYLIVVLSRTSVTSKWVGKEINAALVRQLEEDRVIVLPILIEDCEIPIFLRDLIYADCRTDYPSGLHHTLKRLQYDSRPPEREPECGVRVPLGRNTSFPRQESGDLRIVDVSIHEPAPVSPYLETGEDREDEWEGPARIDPDAFFRPDAWWPVLDFKVRNIGTHVAFIKSTELCILRVARFGNPLTTQRQQVPVSYNYDVLLKPDMKDSKVRINVSQAVKPYWVDRFTFTVAHRGGDVDSPVWYYMRVLLQYNEDYSVCSSPPILLTVPMDVQTKGWSGTPGFRNAVVLENLKLFREFTTLEGLKSPSILRLIGTHQSKASAP